jgi:NitT/TauT family transport system substrate-binding protein
MDMDMGKERHMDTHVSGDQTIEMETTIRPTLARREVLRRAGLGAGLLALAGVAPAAPALARGGAFAVLKARPRVVLGWGGMPCEAALHTAYHKGFFAAEGLDVELYAMPATYNDIRALSSGTLGGEQNTGFAVFPAIEQGADIRLVGGLHGGCVRLVIGKHSGIRKAADFKGKAIGTQGGDAMLFFQLLLAENGVDPRHEVTWTMLDPSRFGAALDTGKVQAIATFDPSGYLLLQQGKAIEVGNNLNGLYGHTAGMGPHRYCCGVALSGKLVRDRPKVAAAIARAWLRGSRYVGGHIHEAAGIETGGKYIPLPQSTVETVLHTYRFNPSATRIDEDIRATARSLKQMGLLRPTTDPAKLAQKTYANVFQLAGEPVPTF